jgi:hypothetical protein
MKKLFIKILISLAVFISGTNISAQEQVLKPLVGALRVDGEVFRFIGMENDTIFKNIAVLVASDTAVSIQAKQDIYVFKCGAVSLELKFITPILPDAYDLTPFNGDFLYYRIISDDKKPHKVEIYFDFDYKRISNNAHITSTYNLVRKSLTGFFKSETLQALAITNGNKAFYAASDKKNVRANIIGNRKQVRNSFLKKGNFKSQYEVMNDGVPTAIALIQDFKKTNKPIDGRIILYLDDEHKNDGNNTNILDLFQEVFGKFDKYNAADEK